MFKMLQELSQMKATKLQEYHLPHSEEKDRFEDLLKLNLAMAKAGEPDTTLLKKIRDELTAGDKEMAHKLIDELLEKYNLSQGEEASGEEAVVQHSEDFENFEAELLTLHHALSTAMKHGEVDGEIKDAMRAEIRAVYDLGKSGDMERAMRELHQFSEKHKNWLR